MTRSHKTRSIKTRFHAGIPGLICSIALALLMAGAVQAQVGRASVTIENEAGDMVEGATVTATSEDGKATLERTSNKKGKVNFAFRDARQKYAIRVEAEGYEPFLAEIEPDSAKLTYQAYTLRPQGSVPTAPAHDAASASEASAPADAPAVEATLSPAQATFNAAVDALKAGNLEDAKTAFSHALSLDPELTLAYSALAGIALEQKDWAAAEQYARSTLAAESDNPRGMQLLYEAQVGSGDQKAAAKTLADLEQMFSGDDAAVVVFNQGAEAFKLGDTARAQEQLEKALGMSPELHQASRLLAVLYVTEGFHDKAIEMADHALARNPSDSMALRVRWDAHRALGNDAEAASALAALQAVDPSAGAASMYARAERDFNAGRTAEALEMLDAVVAIDPNHARAHYLLGLSHVNMGDNAAAKTALERFLELAPDDPQAKDARDMLKFL